MKVAVLGKGLAGVLTALYWRHYSPKTEVELYYDEEIDTEPVGSGSFPGLTGFLADTFGWSLNWHDNPWKATPKFGIKYEGWGDKPEWFHPFNFDEVGMHLDPHLFQDFLCDTGIFKVTQKHIETYDECDADYVYDCRGFPTDYTDYNIITNPLNRVMLSNMPNPDNVPWTRTVTTPDGWTFVIHLQDRVQYGYLYNSDITSDTEAEINFKEQFGVDNITATFPFRNYYAKSPIIDNRVFLNGNRYFFIEPMEATSVAGYMKWIELTMEAVWGEKPIQKIEYDMQRSIKENANFILYHYKFGSKYDTPFWDYAKSLELNDSFIQNIIDGDIRTNMVTYGFHTSQSVMNMYDNLGRIYKPV
jgi:hypothetical protein